MRIDMKHNNIVWSSETGDTRKNSSSSDKSDFSTVDNKKVTLHLRRLTAGKGRTVIEISNLPQNSDWCRDLAKDIKKSIGVAGTYKNSIIEIHTDNIEKISSILQKKDIKWKKTGG
jgi:translation initiation factor 1 (eIF-1/SUI1)